MKIHRAWNECIDPSVPFQDRKYRKIEEELTLGDVTGNPLEIGDKVAWVAGSGTDKKLDTGVLIEVRERRDRDWPCVDLVCKSPENTRNSILTRGFYSKISDGTLCWNQIIKLPNNA